MKFKKLFGVEPYVININGDIKDIYGATVTKTLVKKNKILVSLKDTDCELDFDKVRLLSLYEFDSNILTLENVNNLIFTYVNTKLLNLKYGVIPHCHKPIKIYDDFFLIPSNPRYCINKNGKVLDIKNLDFKESFKTTDSSYEHVSIYDPVVNHAKARPLHRLIGLVFIPTTFTDGRYFINHKDANKSNNDLSNLEWVTMKENAQHAVENDLTNNIRIKVLDIETKKILYFKSLDSFNAFIGNANITLYGLNKKLPGYAFRNRYEIKREDDNSPWFYINKSIGDIGKSLFTITVTDNSTGTEQIFTTIGKVCSFYKIKNDSIINVKKRLEIKYPNLTLTYVKNSLNGPYFVKSFDGKKIWNVTNLKDICKIVDLKHDVVRTLLLEHKHINVRDHFLFSRFSDRRSLNIDTAFRYTKKITCIQVTNSDGTKTYYDSARSASKVLGIGRKIIFRCARYNLTYKELKFELASGHCSSDITGSTL